MTTIEGSFDKDTARTFVDLLLNKARHDDLLLYVKRTRNEGLIGGVTTLIIGLVGGLLMHACSKNPVFSSFSLIYMLACSVLVISYLVHVFHPGRVDLNEDIFKGDVMIKFLTFHYEMNGMASYEKFLKAFTTARLGGSPEEAYFYWIEVCKKLDIYKSEIELSLVETILEREAGM